MRSAPLRSAPGSILYLFTSTLATLPTPTPRALVPTYAAHPVFLGCGAGVPCARLAHRVAGKHIFSDRTVSCLRRSTFPPCDVAGDLTLGPEISRALHACEFRQRFGSGNAPTLVTW
jgi:hypothetical protein